MSSEQWRPIPFSDYSVSARGRVRNDRNGEMLKGAPDNRGYPRVHISINGKRKTCKIHRLVAYAFLGDPPSGKTQVAHKDGNPINNRASNLKWATPTENNRDKARHGTQTCGVDQHKAKLTDEDVAMIRLAAATGVSQSKIAKAYGVSKGNVQFIIHGKTWKHAA